MLLARIQITGGQHRGAVTYACVQTAADGMLSYRPVPDPFEPDTSPVAVSAMPEGPVDSADVVLLAPCRPRVVLGMAHNTGPADRLLPPQAFHKSPHSVVGPGRAIELAPGQDRVDAEAELAVVIGTTARHLTPDTALAAVFGYSCANDVTDRAAQAADSLWTEAKSADTFTPLGPWISTDLDAADVEVLLGDDDGVGPSAGTGDLARSVIEVLVYLTSVMTLHAGDVVLTGAPGASRRLRPGACSHVTIPRIGTLTNPVTIAVVESEADSTVESTVEAAPLATLAGVR